MNAQLPFEKIFAGEPEPVGQPLTGQDLKIAGMESVARHTPDWYVQKFRSAVEKFPRGTTFTVEDIREIAGDPPDCVSANCMGSLMLGIGKKKLAKKTGYYVKAKRVQMNATELAVWIRI